MKLLRITCFIVICFALFRNVSGQSFVNLDFEDAIITPDPSSPYYPNALYASDAIPGWTVGGCWIGPGDIYYNSASLGSTSVSILSTNGNPPAIDGKFSVELYGGGTAPAASISQTGIVPLSAKSILFEDQHFGQLGVTLLVSLGGQNIPLFALSTGANGTTLYCGDISAFAGQREQLMFSALQGEHFWNIDDIQFSSSAIPEPSSLSLFSICTLFLCWRMRRPKKIAGTNAGWRLQFAGK